jgi:hypothetical protein
MLTIRNKTLLLVALIPIVLGLLAHGMRVPDFSGLASGKVKPRPRAVIKNQISTCKQCLEKKYQPTASVLVDPSRYALPPAGGSFLRIPAITHLTALIISHTAARAPPARA